MTQTSMILVVLVFVVVLNLVPADFGTVVGAKEIWVVVTL
jgi:hypothetical protein